MTNGTCRRGARARGAIPKAADEICTLCTRQPDVVDRTCPCDVNRHAVPLSRVSSRQCLAGALGSRTSGGEDPMAVSSDSQHPAGATGSARTAPAEPTGPAHAALADGDPGELQRNAKRHLWLHFTRMGSYAHMPVPVITRGDGCYAVLRQRRSRPRRDRRGGREAGTRARLLHQLELRPPALDRAGHAHRTAGARQPQPRVLHLGRLRGGGVCVEARQGLSRRSRGKLAPQAHLARAGLPRQLDGSADGDRADPAAHPV